MPATPGRWTSYAPTFYLDILNGDHVATSTVGGGGVEIVVLLATLMGCAGAPRPVTPPSSRAQPAVTVA